MFPLVPLPGAWGNGRSKSSCFSGSRAGWFLLLWPVWWGASQLLWAQNVPQPPPQPSRAVNNPAVISPGASSDNDPNFPQLQLTETPLDVPNYLGGSGSSRTKLLYRKLIVEAYFGYYGAVLNLYNISKTQGNNEGNTRESNWNNLSNIIFGPQISGNIRKFHYSLWFGMALNLGGDYIRLRDYEFGTDAAKSVVGRTNDDISYRGTFPNKVQHLLLGGLRLGYSLVDRKSAKLSLGLGGEGFLGEWKITGGNDYKSLLLGLDSTTKTKTKVYSSDTKNLSLFAVQVLPFVYLQGGAFLLSFLEIFASFGYSPATLWVTEENRFYELAPMQYRRYGYLGQ
ncbi:MAG: hypothetical protein AAF975_02355, partial [Spirochaetota bacterium]